jgi:hypothetical protein
MDPTSEQKLKQLLEEGKITEEEFRQLLEAMLKQERLQGLNLTPNQQNHRDLPSLRNIPWQIWVVVVLLHGGYWKLFMIPKYPWPPLAFGEGVFYNRPLTRLEMVFIAFLIIAGIHVLYFGAAGAWLVSFLNLILIILAYSAKRHFFHIKTIENLHYPNQEHELWSRPVNRTQDPF